MNLLLCGEWDDAERDTWAEALRMAMSPRDRLLLRRGEVDDALIKGLKHPAWPMDAWDAVRRLALLVVQAVASAPPARGRAPVMMRLALQAEHRLD